MTDNTAMVTALVRLRGALQEARLPLEDRNAISLMVAVRPWVPQAFKALRRR